LTGHYYAAHKAVVADRSRLLGAVETQIVGCVIAWGTVENKELSRTLTGRPHQLAGYELVVRAAEMSEQQCLPGATEPAMLAEGSGVHSSPTRAAGAATARRVRHSPSTPLIGGYNGRRWWSLSSTNVWCAATDHSDFDHISRGTLMSYPNLSLTLSVTTGALPDG